MADEIPEGGPLTLEIVGITLSRSRHYLCRELSLGPQNHIVTVVPLARRENATIGTSSARGLTL